MKYWKVPNTKEEKKKIIKSKLIEAEIIIEKIRNYYKLTEKELMGRCKLKIYVKARFIAMYIIRASTNFTMVEIGEMFNRDHTTVVYAIQVVNDVLSLHYETDFSEDIKEIKKIFELSTILS